MSVLARRTLLAWEAPVPVTKTGAPYLRKPLPTLRWSPEPAPRWAQQSPSTVSAFEEQVLETKPSGVKRVVVLGDSTVYGHGVEDDETFSAQLDDRLGETVQVLNLGTPGYSSAQSINLMTMRGWRLQPDLVVIANLWSDNNFDNFVDETLSRAQ